MGIQEMLFGVGALILLTVIAYGAVRAGRVRQSKASIEATKRNFDKAE